MAIATTPKIQKKVYQPMYMPTSLLASISLASDHQLSHTAVDLNILVSYGFERDLVHLLANSVQKIQTAMLIRNMMTIV
jgi:hypothetical protein